MSWNNYNPSEFGINNEGISGLFRTNTTVKNMFSPVDVECGINDSKKKPENKDNKDTRKITTRELVNILKALMLNGQDPGYHSTQQRLVFNKPLCERLNITPPGIQDYNRAYEIASRDTEIIIQDGTFNKNKIERRDSIVQSILDGSKKPEMYNNVSRNQPRNNEEDQYNPPPREELIKLMSQLMANGGYILPGERGFNQISKQAAWKTFLKRNKWDEPELEDWIEARKRVEKQDKVVQYFIEKNADKENLPAVAEHIRNTIRSEHNNAKLIAMIVGKSKLPQLTDYKKSLPVDSSLESKKEDKAKSKLAISDIGNGSPENLTTEVRELLNIVKAYYTLGGNPERGKVPTAVSKFIETNGKKYNNLKKLWSRAVFAFDISDRRKFNSVINQYDIEELKEAVSNPNTDTDSRTELQDFLSRWGNRMEKKYADESSINITSKISTINSDYRRLLEDAEEAQRLELEDYLAERPWIIQSAAKEYGVDIEYPEDEDEARDIAAIAIENPDLLGEEATQALDTYYNRNLMENAIAFRNYEATEQEELSPYYTDKFKRMTALIYEDLMSMNPKAVEGKAPAKAKRLETKEDIANQIRNIKKIQSKTAGVKTELYNLCNAEGCPGSMTKFGKTFREIESLSSAMIERAEKTLARIDPEYVPPVIEATQRDNFTPKESNNEVRNVKRDYRGDSTSVVNEGYDKQLSKSEVAPKFDRYSKEIADITRTINEGFDNSIDVTNAIRRIQRLQDKVKETREAIITKCESDNITRGLETIDEVATPILHSINKSLREVHIIKSILEKQ